MKFITVNETHNASIFSFDNIFMGFEVRGFQGLKFLKNPSESSFIGLELIGEGKNMYNFPKEIYPASYIEIDGAII